ncbi:hypothetical protein K501DRAFT_310369 [Backusella circina FSU 941]|nr:hypothetical protein K501DRAFT_310369 [Backusella circina FSU 941]
MSGLYIFNFYSLCASRIVYKVYSDVGCSDILTRIHYWHLSHEPTALTTKNKPRKLMFDWIGPYLVNKVNSTTTVTLKDIKSDKLVLNSLHSFSLYRIFERSGNQQEMLLTENIPSRAGKLKKDLPVIRCTFNYFSLYSIHLSDNSLTSWHQMLLRLQLPYIAIKKKYIRR